MTRALLVPSILVSVAVALATTAVAQVAPQSQPEPKSELDPGRAIEASPLEIVWRRELTSWTYALMFSANGRRLVAHHGDTVSLFDAADATMVREIHARAPRGTRSVALSATDTLAVTAGTYVDLYDLGSGVPIDRIACSACNRVIRGLAFSPDGRWLALQDVADPTERSRGLGAVRVVDLDTRQVIVELPGVGIGSIPTVAFSRDGRKLLASHVTGKDVGFRVWDTSDWKVLQTKAFAEMGSIEAGAVGRAKFVSVHGNGENVEMRALPSAVVLWSVAMVQPEFEALGSHLVLHRQQLRHVAVAPDGSFVVTYEGQPANSGRIEGAIVVRRTRDGSILAVNQVFDVTSVAIAPDSKTFAFTFRLDPVRHQMVLAHRIPSAP